jgi:Arginase family
VPPRYRMRPEETGIRNQSALVRYTAKLAARVDRLIGAGNFPLLPAVDAPEPGGITLEQARDALARLVADQAAAGMDVTILDPDLDEEGEQIAALADVLVDALRPARQTALLHV